MVIDDSELLKIYDSVLLAWKFHNHRDIMNCAKHGGGLVRLSPLTSMLSSAIDSLETLFRENHIPGWSGNPDEMVAGEQRYMPEWGSTVVKRREDGDYVKISDIFGGHEVRIPKQDWDALPVNPPDVFVGGKPYSPVRDSVFRHPAVSPFKRPTPG